MRFNPITALGDALGRGLIAGLAGTAAMTISSTVEMKLRGRNSSKTPAQAICKALELETVNEESQERLNNLVHWGYGTALGAARGVIGALGLSGWPANLLFFGIVWGAEHTMLPKLEVAPPLDEQPPEVVATDVLHHLVYAEATGSFFDALSSRGAGRRSR